MCGLIILAWFNIFHSQHYFDNPKYILTTKLNSHRILLQPWNSDSTLLHTVYILWSSLLSIFPILYSILLFPSSPNSLLSKLL